MKKEQQRENALTFQKLLNQSVSGTFKIKMFYEEERIILWPAEGNRFASRFRRFIKPYISKEHSKTHDAALTKSKKYGEHYGFSQKAVKDIVGQLGALKQQETEISSEGSVLSSTGDLDAFLIEKNKVGFSGSRTLSEQIATDVVKKDSQKSKKPASNKKKNRKKTKPEAKKASIEIPTTPPGRFITLGRPGTGMLGAQIVRRTASGLNVKYRPKPITANHNRTPFVSERAKQIISRANDFFYPEVFAALFDAVSVIEAMVQNNDLLFQRDEVPIAFFGKSHLQGLDNFLNQLTPPRLGKKDSKAYFKLQKIDEGWCFDRIELESQKIQALIQADKELVTELRGRLAPINENETLNINAVFNQLRRSFLEASVRAQSFFEGIITKPATLEVPVYHESDVESMYDLESSTQSKAGSLVSNIATVRGQRNNKKNEYTGAPPESEDAHVHGGVTGAFSAHQLEVLAERVMQEVVGAVKAEGKSGTTATAMAFSAGNVVTANVGDSRSSLLWLLKKEDKVHVVPQRLTADHDPTKMPLDIGGFVQRLSGSGNVFAQKIYKVSHSQRRDSSHDIRFGSSSASNTIRTLGDEGSFNDSRADILSFNMADYARKIANKEGGEVLACVIQTCCDGLYEAGMNEWFFAARLEQLIEEHGVSDILDLKIDLARDFVCVAHKKGSTDDMTLIMTPVLASEWGKRKDAEECVTSYWAGFDGHNGATASRMAANKMEEQFPAIAKALIKKDKTRLKSVETSLDQKGFEQRQNVKKSSLTKHLNDATRKVKTEVRRGSEVESSDKSFGTLFHSDSEGEQKASKEKLRKSEVPLRRVSSRLTRLATSSGPKGFEQHQNVQKSLSSQKLNEALQRQKATTEAKRRRSSLGAKFASDEESSDKSFGTLFHSDSEGEPQAPKIKSLKSESPLRQSSRSRHRRGLTKARSRPRKLTFSDTPGEYSLRASSTSHREEKRKQREHQR